MTYVYEGELTKVEGDWTITVTQFGGGYFGASRSIANACRDASEALRLYITGKIDDGEPLPRAIFHNPPQVVLCVEVDEAYLAEARCMSISDAADWLGVTRGRVSQLIKSGGLVGARIDGRHMVTIASVNARKEASPTAGRPRNEN